MSSLRSQTARLLLERVPENERAQVLQNVANSLNIDSGTADVAFAATLLQLQPDDVANKCLLDHLQSLVQRGEQEQVVSVISHHSQLEADLVHRNLSILGSSEKTLETRPGRWITVPLEDRQSQDTGDANFEDEDMTIVLDRAVNCLQTLSRVVSVRSAPTSSHALFDSCIFFLGTADRRLVEIAQKSLFALLDSQQSLSEAENHRLWDRIQSLVSATDVNYKTVGLSLWLRWLLSSQGDLKFALQQPLYWELIDIGLRNGDSERRKAALQVLRSSIDASAEDPSLQAIFASVDPRNPPSSGMTQKQYGRFCTVFETIVLGRYLNQVQQCEADLDFLASEHSVVQSKWLYTLLASALDHKMQDSNRKFVGAWIMRSQLPTEDFDRYLEFLRSALLPWASGGHLFTSSLREAGSSLRCEHGERLANFVSESIQKQPTSSVKVVDTILDYLLSRYANNFAYSMVYLVDGIGQAFNSANPPELQASHTAKLQRIASWSGFPDVARDYILARTWKLGHDQKLDNGNGEHSTPWIQLREKSESLPFGATVHVEGNIASVALDPSRRDQQERKAIQKCMSLVKDMNANGAEIDSANVGDTIDDIWEDLDYLEYPKSLLVVLPRLILHQRLVELAKDDSGTSGNLEAMLSTRIRTLLELSDNRSYLVPPLISAIRQVALQNKDVSSLLQLEDVIMYLAGNPSAPTIDAQLEDATTLLLQSLGPGMEKFSYEYYYGPREVHGVAALLDLVNRLGATDVELARRLLSRLLERWRDQKIPPPTITGWKSTLQLQVMLLCCDQYVKQTNKFEAKRILDDLHFILAIEPLPRYRYLLEWMIARVYLCHLELRSNILAELATKDHHSNPKFLAALMKIGAIIAKTDNSDESFALQLASGFVPMAASSKVVIRHEAQWQVPILMDHARARGWSSISNDTAFVALDAFIRSLFRFSDPPRERLIDKLDPIKDHNLTHLVEGPWYGLDEVKQKQTTREHFLKLYESDTANSVPSLPPSSLPLGDPIPPPPPFPAEEIPIPNPTLTAKLHQNITTISQTLGSNPAPLALQTKGTAYLVSARTRHTNLLVIASLVDNPHNLGGLSRVSEIFGAGALYVQNPTVTSTKDFLAVSVSSHFHFPILPLAAEPAILAGFLAEKRRVEGFSVVGIEQTDRSVMLGSGVCVLPEKCVLVVGSEREGIPAVVLGECDLLVEIRQVGLTRSLNVQTAAGIVLCEYARQHAK